MYSLLLGILLLASPPPGANDLLQQGMKSYEHGDYDQAISQLKTAVEQTNDSEKKASAYLALGIIYQLMNDIDQAKMNFSKAIIVNPNLQLDRDFYSSRTIELFDEAKQEGLTQIKKGKQLYLDGEYDRALEHLSTGINLLLTTSPKIDRAIIIDAYLTSAKIHQLMAKDDLAVAEFQKALNLNPALQLDADLYSPSTIKIFEQARQGPERISTQAEKLIAARDLDAAMKLLEQNSFAYFSRSAKTQQSLLLAEIYFLKKDENRAAQEMDQCMISTLLPY